MDRSSNCPKCSGILVLRTNSKTGKRFLGCSGYPNCRHTQPLESLGTTIYVLRLKQEKYYIGKSSNPDKRIKAHFKGEASDWTKRYPPESVVERINNCDPYDEDKTTKIYMARYGIDNVRGGTYCQISLSEAVQKQLQTEIWGANDKCFRCGGDHLVKDCTQGKSRSFFSIVRSWLRF